MILTSNKTIVFDLDDTLYSECDFEKSGIEFVYNFLKVKNFTLESILNNRENWIQKFISESNVNISIESILDLYRNHTPNIELYNDSKLFLEKLISKGFEISLITDGRSITQRNKLKSLGIESIFKTIVISDEVKSEKPSEHNFRLVMNNSYCKDYVYIADNPGKDFLTPNHLGWTTICLMDRGSNVHNQNFNLSKKYLPNYFIKNFDEIELTNEK
jgi:putative hydrolase of the HAD superfamily